MASEYYNKNDDIISVNFGEVEHSRELKNVNLVVDFDKKDNIVGIEIFDFLKALDKSQEEINKIFDKSTSCNTEKRKGGKNNE